MSKKTLLLLTIILSAIVLINNSCKKQQEITVTQQLTAGPWQLASVLVTHTNNLQVTVDTLYTNCNSTQVLRLNTDGTSTYTNFGCIVQNSSGNWNLSQDQLTLSSDMVCKDGSAIGTSMPFQRAQVLNAGAYSLVLQTGNYDVIPTTTNSTTVTRYGFVHPGVKN